MAKNATIDTIPIAKKIQNNPIDWSVPPPRKVILNMNVLTVSIRVIRPGISIILLKPLGLVSLTTFSSTTLGINFQSKNKNNKAKGIALKNTPSHPTK
jgi:hypothetical protein